MLSLGAAALGHTTIPSVTQMLEGATLVMLGLVVLVLGLFTTA